MKGRKRVTPELAYHQQQHGLSIYYLLHSFPEERASSRRPMIQFVCKTILVETIMWTQSAR
jgi:hypothetical protein